MGCKPGSSKSASQSEGGSGYPEPDMLPEPAPRWGEEMASTESAWDKGFLMDLRNGMIDEPERLPDGDWRVNLISDGGPAFVIIHHDQGLSRHLAVLFDDDGRRVARLTSDADTHSQALANLIQIASYEESAVFNLQEQQARDLTQAKREENRRKKVVKAATQYKIGDAVSKTLIDERIGGGCREIVCFKMGNVGRQYYLRRSDAPGESLLLRNAAMLDYARMVLTDQGGSAKRTTLPEPILLYPEGQDHDSVERSLRVGINVPASLVMHYPDLLERFVS